MHTALHRFTRLRLHLATAVCCILVFNTAAPAQVMTEQHSLRELSGTVSDGHEPLRGAVVQLEQEGTHDVLTYLTEADGHYHFKRLNTNTDYEVWVVFRTRHSKHHQISKFDDHLDKVINFNIQAF